MADTEATEEATEEMATTVAEEPTAEATEEAGEEPTEAAMDEATDEATAEATDEAVTLDATFTSEDGSVTFDYPANWVVQEQSPNQFVLASSQEAFDTTTGAPGTGDFLAVIFVNSIDDMPELSPGATPAEVVDAFALSLNEILGDEGDAGSETTEEATEEAGDVATEEAGMFGEPTETTVGDRDAARIEASRDDGDAVVYAIDLGDDVFAVIVGASASGEMSDFDAVLQAIAETITYTPMESEEATEEATEESGG
jgi:hypothetical protein